eukprot:jgi/Botrbrau1/20992/Bobra.0144s0011.1
MLRWFVIRSIGKLRLRDRAYSHSTSPCIVEEYGWPPKALSEPISSFRIVSMALYYFQSSSRQPLPLMRPGAASRVLWVDKGGKLVSCMPPLGWGRQQSRAGQIALPVYALKVEELEKMTVVQLKNELGSRGLTKSGLKADLVERLLAAVEREEAQAEAVPSNGAGLLAGAGPVPLQSAAVQLQREENVAERSSVPSQALPRQADASSSKQGPASSEAVHVPPDLRYSSSSPGDGREGPSGVAPEGLLAVDGYVSPGGPAGVSLVQSEETSGTDVGRPAAVQGPGDLRPGVPQDTPRRPPGARVREERGDVDDDDTVLGAPRAPEREDPSRLRSLREQYGGERTEEEELDLIAAGLPGEEGPHQIYRMLWHPKRCTQEQVEVTGMAVTWLGTSSGAPTPRRNVSCILLRLPSQTIMVDCGEGSSVQYSKAGLNPKAVRTICITHMHGDHVFGLPGMLRLISQAYEGQGTEEEIPTVRIFGPKGLWGILLASLKFTQEEFRMPVEVTEFTVEGLGDERGVGEDPAEMGEGVPQGALPGVTVASLFPDAEPARRPPRGTASPRGSPGDTFREERLQFGDNPWQGRNTWTVKGEGGITMVAARLRHRVFCVGYVFSEPVVPPSLNAEALAAAGISPEAVVQTLKKLGPDGQVLLPNGESRAVRELMFPPRRGRKVVLLGDTMDSDFIAGAGRNADLLSHEATFSADMYHKAMVAKHSTAAMAGAFARRINAATLILTHFSPRITAGKEVDVTMNDTNTLIKQAKTTFGKGNVWAASDFSTYIVPQERPPALPLPQESGPDWQTQEDQGPLDRREQRHGSDGGMRGRGRGRGRGASRGAPPYAHEGQRWRDGADDNTNVWQQGQRGGRGRGPGGSRGTFPFVEDGRRQRYGAEDGQRQRYGAEDGAQWQRYRVEDGQRQWHGDDIGTEGPLSSSENAWGPERGVERWFRGRGQRGWGGGPGRSHRGRVPGGRGGFRGEQGDFSRKPVPGRPGRPGPWGVPQPRWQGGATGRCTPPTARCGTPGDPRERAASS